ncbi:ABC transporter ATP-binding protein [Brucella pseudogrignonensis]|uniref:ABC transporter ATP-binding protein n=1 Tax=Brucella pseudogrignonensis TaxID=419475 RepID=UPI00124F6AAB|nr:ABC transporter ATP-binding protein [Brucella pseudogrignonensis]KAB2683240.1 ABC transporter ATP-binding protein [Brucella pseudogrignonensis]
MKKLLEVKGISKRFGGLQAVSELSFDLRQGEILGLLGPNGAGKTTAFNMIAGALRTDTGDILFDGKSLVGKAPWDICRLGIGRTYQLSKPFGGLSVVENIMVGAFVRAPSESAARNEAEEIANFLGLTGKMNVDADDLTAVDRRKLELGRALATQPKLLLMDEVVAGATPQEASEMVELVKQVRDRGVTILIVEHVMKVIMGLSDRVIVLDYGKLIANGAPRDVVNQPEVMKAYFGERYVQSRA